MARHDLLVQNDAAQRQLWRVSSKGRVCAVLVFLIWLALTLWITIGGNRTPGAGAAPTVILWIGTAAIALGAWRCSFVPYVEATSPELVICNPLGMRRIP